jgi:hypothetical protein
MTKPRLAIGCSVSVSAPATSTLDAPAFLLARRARRQLGSVTREQRCRARVLVRSAPALRATEDNSDRH